MAMIRVKLPQHLRTLAGIEGSEVEVAVEGAVSAATVLDALEAEYPMLKGTIRDHGSKQRRAYIRYFACQEDISHDAPEEALPAAVAKGREPFMVVGAISGG